MSSNGVLVVIAGPSGAGKTTLSHHLVDSFDDTGFSVSTTTRKPRGEEVNGKDYDFVTADEFQSRIKGDFFLEWAKVHGNYYGTDGNWVRGELSKGRSVILDIDVQGAVQVKNAVPSAVLVFVLPKSRDTLLERLRGRSTDSEETVSRRMMAAAGEVASLGSFDYFILNDELHRAQSALESVFSAERMKIKNLGWPYPAREYDAAFFRGLSCWRNKRIVVSSGPTREMIDQVRFISNRSSGLMGVSLSEAFLEAGADVTLVTGPAKEADPPGPVRLIKVNSAQEMLETLSTETRGADLLVMAAAVADFKPVETWPGKLRRTGSVLDLHLQPTSDILASLEPECPVLAFALEYGEGASDSALSKMSRKGAAAVFMNRGDLSGQGMETPENAGVLFFSSGSDPVKIPRGSKKHTAFGIAAALGREFERKTDDQDC